MTCKLYDLYSNSFVIYTEPIYTKYNGVNGYLIVSQDNIYFFYVYDDIFDRGVTYDNVSDKFKVEYTSDK